MNLKKKKKGSNKKNKKLNGHIKLLKIFSKKLGLCFFNKTKNGIQFTSSLNKQTNKSQIWLFGDSLNQRQYMSPKKTKFNQRI